MMIDKITSRISKLCYNLNTEFIDPTEITLKVINGIYSGVTTGELDRLAAETAACMTTKHPDYQILAARIEISNLHKQTRMSKTFSQTVQLIHDSNPKTINKTFYEFVVEHAHKLNSAIIYDRDYKLNYFGFKTLERSYLIKINNNIIERPQHMFMRVAVSLSRYDVAHAIYTYNLLSEFYYIHATPTLYNAGALYSQLSSCFLVAMNDDSIKGIFKTLGDCAQISKYAGGIGLHVHNIRASGSVILGTQGVSNGLVPMLRVFNNTSRYVDQGGNKRPGSFAIYLEPWHADIFEFLDLRKNTGIEDMRARDLFYALWIPDLFMKRVEENGDWCLMCPRACPDLHNVYGNEFNRLYTKYEQENRYKTKIKAQKLWFAIIEAQIETGQPYMVYKDACNEKSNQKNIGTIKSSNLCTEIVEYSSETETAVCNLCSISLPKFVENSRNDHKIIGSYKDYIIDDESNSEYLRNITKTNDVKRNNIGNNYNQRESTSIDDKLHNNTRFSDNSRLDTINNDNLNNIKINDENVPINNNSSQINTNINNDFNKLSINEQNSNIKFDDIKKHKIKNENFIDTNINSTKISFDFNKLHEVTKIIVVNMNSVIDCSYFPVKEAETSQNRHRPIGIGVQGLADVFVLLRMPFESPQAAELNKLIFETIYHAALESSCEQAQIYGAYESFNGSPASQGLLQFDLWGTKPSDRYDWDALKTKIKKYGLRNSLLTTCMPTASTSQILGNNESIEPYTSNIYTRRVISGEFQVVNKHLMYDLIKLNLWNEDMRLKILANKGSIQNIEEIPQDIRELYKTAWEISMKSVIDQSADRGPYIDQSQSLNLFVSEPKLSKITSMHFYAWKKGLKTGMYYLRTRPAAQPIQFTVDKQALNKKKVVCTDDVCISCQG